MNQLIYPEFLWIDNVEFVISNTTWNITKVLYRSYGDNRVFRKKVLDFFIHNKILLPQEEKKIIQIFQHELLKHLDIHFAIDTSNSRYKFYISLYQSSFKKWLQILSEIKKILQIQQPYFLEKNFFMFDCLGFDVRHNGIEMKVYELLVRDSINPCHIPSYIDMENIKEHGVLKGITGRRKEFFRLWHTMDIHDFWDRFSFSFLWALQKQLWSHYSLQNRVKYYCREGEKQEIYFA